MDSLAMIRLPPLLPRAAVAVGCNYHALGGAGKRKIVAFIGIL
jgi:hypothetical protein